MKNKMHLFLFYTRKPQTHRNTQKQTETYRETHRNKQTHTQKHTKTVTKTCTNTQTNKTHKNSQTPPATDISTNKKEENPLLLGCFAGIIFKVGQTLLKVTKLTLKVRFHY